ncbi:MAG: hypothetical protein LBG94_02095 [Treponema sp.]|jgi:hypothetical protein|nr:hypothetical protein [Treponema sp.]
MKNVFRRFLMIGLILTMGMVMGCGESGGGGKSNTPNNNEPTGGKVVAVQYRGTYKEVHPNSGIITLNEKTMISLGKEIPAWSVGNILWIVDGGGTREYGKFENNDLIGEHFHYQKQD